MSQTVPMLLYHKVADVPPGSGCEAIHVPPARFAEQLALLRRLGYRSVTLRHYLAARRGEAELPPRPVVLTFDDGYRDNYEAAFPLLQEHGFTATIFVVSRLLGGSNVWDPDEPPAPLLDAPQIAEMQRAGIDFQSHTCTHARLTAVPPDRALRELRDSREDLEQLLGAPVDAVAYPWGAHDAAVEGLARDAGYAAGCIVRRRTNFATTPPFALRRIPVYHCVTAPRLTWDLLRLPWRGA